MKIYFSFLFIAFISFLEFVQSTDCSKKKSVTLNGKEYRLFRRLKDYEDARKSCQVWGKKKGSKMVGLANVLNPEIQTCLTEMITTRSYSRIWNHLNPFARGYYIGGNDKNEEGSWYWDDYDPIPLRHQNGFQKWGTFEPNDHNSQDCLLMLFRNIDQSHFRTYKAGTWVDISCQYRRFFICERELPNMKPSKPAYVPPKPLPKELPSLQRKVEGDELEWGYRNSLKKSLLTPENWQRGFPECGGTRQSPIHIDFNDVKECKIPGPTTVATWGSDAPNVKWHIKNTGKTIEIRIKPARSLYTKFKGNSRKLFVDYMKLSWGDSNQDGSEHRIGSHYLDGEFQIFHHPEKKGGERHALAFMLQERPFIANNNWADLLRHINTVQVTNLEKKMEASPSLLYQLLGDTASSNRHSNARYVTAVGVRYRGSITHPPCTADVIWTVYPRPITLAFHQFCVLRRVIGEDGDVLGGNARPLQPFSGPLCRVK